MFCTKTFIVLRYRFTPSVYLKTEQSGDVGIISGEVIVFSEITTELYHKYK